MDLFLSSGNILEKNINNRVFLSLSLNNPRMWGSTRPSRQAERGAGAVSTK